MSTLVQLQGPAFVRFYGAIRSPYTREVYRRCLSEFVDFLFSNGMISAKSADSLLIKDADLIEQWIISKMGPGRS
jgi:hypothetical protein